MNRLFGAGRRLQNGAGALAGAAKAGKALAGAAKAGFALTGSVIGAGFISGAELVRFFPSQGFLPYIAAAALLFFGCFFLLFECGRRYGGFAGTVQAVFGRRAAVVRAAVLVGSFVTCGSMLAGLAALAGEGFGLPALCGVFRPPSCALRRRALDITDAPRALCRELSTLSTGFPTAAGGAKPDSARPGPPGGPEHPKPMLKTAGDAVNITSMPALRPAA